MASLTSQDSSSVPTINPLMVLVTVDLDSFAAYLYPSTLSFPLQLH